MKGKIVIDQDGISKIGNVIGILSLITLVLFSLKIKFIQENVSQATKYKIIIVAICLFMVGIILTNIRLITGDFETVTPVKPKE